MQKDQWLRRFGLVGLVVGVAALVVGPFVGELGGMVAGYGGLVVVSAAYLLAGLAIRERLHRRTRARRPVPVYSER